MQYNDMNKKLIDIFGNIENELIKATTKFPKGFHSNHEALGVIREEYKELECYIFEFKDVYHMTDVMKKECIQIAAMAIRFLLDRGNNEN